MNFIASKAAIVNDELRGYRYDMWLDGTAKVDCRAVSRLSKRKREAEERGVTVTVEGCLYALPEKGARTLDIHHRFLDIHPLSAHTSG